MIHEFINTFVFFMIGFSSGIFACAYLGYRAAKKSREKKMNQIKETIREIDKMMAKLGFKRQVELEQTDTPIIQDETGKVVSPIQVKKEQ